MSFDVFRHLYTDSILAFTTNGVVKKDGCLVMGRGIAYAVKQRFKGIDKALGRLVSEGGNRVFYLGDWNYKGRQIGLVSFPTKHGLLKKEDVSIDMVLHQYRDDFLNTNKKYIEGWKLYSDINLIERSLQELTEIDFTKKNARMHLFLNR